MDNIAFRKTITESDVHLFAGLVGDFFGVHTNQAMAQQTQYGTRIAHGAYVVGVMVAGLNRWNPSYRVCGVQVKFRRPVKIGETVRIRVDSPQVVPSRARLHVSVSALRENDEVAVEGVFTLSAGPSRQDQ